MGKEVIVKLLEKELGKKYDFDKLLEKPKLESQGDFSLPLFFLSKEVGKAPQIIAKDIEEKLKNKLPKSISHTLVIGPYLNFYLDNSKVVKDVVKSLISPLENTITITNPQKILIEYPSPNTNKALHIGHLRNILLGNSLSNIFEKVGHKVIRTNLNNDRGIAICKAMLGFELYYKNDTPKSLDMKSDSFVEMCYVKFEAESKKDESLLVKAQEMLVKWEKEDKKVRALWKKLLDWVYEGYEETHKKLKLEKFDKVYYESEIYDKGREIILDALKKKVKGLKKDGETGAVLFDFENETYGKKYLLRGDGTTLYMTQDIYLASEKVKNFKADKYIFIVGKEQEYHFQVLFQVLERFGFGGISKNHHYAYGYVYDKDGNKFSSRKGNVLGADGLLDLVFEKAKESLKSKEISKTLSEKEINRRAEIIGYCAITFSILNTNPFSDMKFDVDKALSFEGETGPYIQYTYARIQSLLNKGNFDLKNKIDYNKFSDKEVSLVKLLGEYNEKVIDSSEKMKPSTIGNYLINVCSQFNEFYQNCPILKEEKQIKDNRLMLCYITSVVIKDALSLFKIEILNEM